MALQTREVSGMNFKQNRLLFAVAWLSITCMVFSANINQNIKDKNMKNIWKAYVNYWEMHDNKIKINLGDTQKDIESLEIFFDTFLVQPLKESLLSQYHYSRRGNDGLRYSWFGDKIETNFLTSKMMIEEYKQFLSKMEINEDGMQSIYIGDIKPYKGKGWTKEWLPILTRYDVDITLFLDLRNDSNSYGQVLALLYYHETTEYGFHNRFAFVSDSFEDFMQEALEYIKIHKGLDNAYFLKKLKLPMNYFQRSL